jgi:hypothetical protein
MITQEIVNIKDISFINSGRGHNIVNGKKICSICKKLKPLNEFANNILCSAGKDYRCKICQRKQNRIYYAKSIGKNIDEVRKSPRIVDGKKLCNHCNKWKLVNCFSKFERNKCGLRSDCRKCCNIWHRIKSNLIKMEFVKEYGGCCACCGETQFEKLTVEHVRNKGYELVHESSTMTLLFKLKELKWPKKEYKCLCITCNLLGSYGRPCIHTEEYKLREKEFREFLKNDSRREEYYRLEKELKTMKGG